MKPRKFADVFWIAVAVAFTNPMCHASPFGRVVKQVEKTHRDVVAVPRDSQIANGRSAGRGPGDVPVIAHWVLDEPDANAARLIGGR
jgi:hypothetical protein